MLCVVYYSALHRMARKEMDTGIIGMHACSVLLIFYINANADCREI